MKTKNAVAVALLALAGILPPAAAAVELSRCDEMTLSPGDSRPCFAVVFQLNVPKKS
jgi:hypothetical protein